MVIATAAVWLIVAIGMSSYAALHYVENCNTAAMIYGTGSIIASLTAIAILLFL